MSMGLKMEDDTDKTFMTRKLLLQLLRCGFHITPLKSVHLNNVPKVAQQLPESKMSLEVTRKCNLNWNCSNSNGDQPDHKCSKCNELYYTHEDWS